MEQAELTLFWRNFCYTIFACGFVVQLVHVLISILVFSIVKRCAVLHWNFKVLLLEECISSVLMAFSRQVQIMRLFAAYPFESKLPVPLLFITSTTMSINNLLTVAYIAERIWATVFARTYENQRPLFGAIYAAVITAASAGVACSEVFKNSTGKTVESNPIGIIMAVYLYDAVGLLCVMVAIFLLRYNLRRYELPSRFGRTQGLTERYQISENVRTTRQLLPVTSFHVLGTFLMTAFVTTSFFWPLEQDRFVPRQLLHFSYGIVYVLSKAAVCMSHPVLRRDALRLFTQIKASIGCKTRIGTSTTAQLRPQSLSGKSLITNPEDEVRTHFETLAATWNQHYEKSKRTDAIQPL